MEPWIGGMMIWPTMAEVLVLNIPIKGIKYIFIIEFVGKFELFPEIISSGE